MFNVSNIIERINISDICFPAYSLKEETTFKVGGPAQLCIIPRSIEELQKVLIVLNEESVVPTVLGGGANVVISDNGVQGVVILTKLLSKIIKDDNGILAQAGSAVSAVSEFALENSLSGLSFIYKMPGTTGGAVWMNARCYDASIADVIDWIEYFDEKADLCRMIPNSGDFSYKDSTFQHNKWTIARCRFSLKPGNKETIKLHMKTVAEDREKKGHFKYPCAGSVFKNNRAFGKPTGQIVDEAGLKGFSIGGAQIAPFHGNIIINNGNASASDIYRLTYHVRSEIKKKYGYLLEPEILFIGF